MKQEFILEEFWSLSISGAFQRANVYKKEANEKDKADFKKALKSLIVFIAKKYQTNVSEQEHIENIHKIKNLEHASLNFQHLNFGVSQKLLNLYLKYLWCIDSIPTPPHFPVDRIIQEKLFKKNLSNWTEMKDEKPYLLIIEKAKEKAMQENIKSIAELELKIFERRKP
jgi:hypothetical protein